ncbi:hypothetical protein AALP_AA8G502500 [Arabis alpina]|uniref:SCP domain-containing protein n=1 Tax=Arabis alpina TaxID=50452 RepID=A0A087GEN2_ARAAL|nr:hypothetical protein AALP_AA8G502500 [Arabis alpina]
MAITHHIIILVSLLVISVSAVTPPAKLKPTQTVPVLAEDFTNEHNKVRATFGIPPLVWSQTLEAAAIRLARYQRNQRQCAFASPKDPGKYGVNQLIIQQSVLRLVTPSEAVRFWVNQRTFYDYESNTCESDHWCNNYLQIVWRDTKEVGCAQVRCAKESTVFFFWKKKESSLLTICLYNPPGNVLDQKPY